MEKDVMEIVKAFNHASLYGDADTVKKCLHRNVVFVGPDLKTLTKGRIHCVQTIVDYNQVAKTLNFELLDATITQDYTDHFVAMEYIVEYELENKVHKEKGTELLVLTNENDVWQIIWRAIIKFEAVE